MARLRVTRARYVTLRCCCTSTSLSTTRNNIGVRKQSMKTNYRAEHALNNETKFSVEYLLCKGGTCNCAEIMDLISKNAALSTEKQVDFELPKNCL